MIKLLEIKDRYVFPMFKNGWTSLNDHANKHKLKWLINEQCARVDEVVVFVRDPKERFVSGVHTFIELHRRMMPTLHYDTVLHMIANREIVNDHFVAQHVLLSRLAQYFQGRLDIKSMSDLDQFVDVRRSPTLGQYGSRTGLPRITESQRNAILKVMPEDMNDEYVLYSAIGRKENIKHVLPAY